MLTASAVVAASFLQLDRPGVILAAVIGPTSFPAAWRVWAVVLVVLLYQTWRLCTDKKTKAIRKAANDFYRGQWSAIAQTSLTKQALLELRKVHAGETDKRGHYFGSSVVGLKWDHLALSVSDRDQAGYVLPLDDLLQSGKPLSFNVYSRPHNNKGTRAGEVSLGELTLNLQPSRSRHSLWRLRALVNSWVHSSDAQDLLVPMALSFLAIAWCVWEIFNSLTPSKFWI